MLFPLGEDFRKAFKCLEEDTLFEYLKWSSYKKQQDSYTMMYWKCQAVFTSVSHLGTYMSRVNLYVLGFPVHEPVYKSVCKS